MLENNQKIKYFIYARKSQEAEDRQVQSIDDQLGKLKEVSKRFELNVVKVFTEAKSAKLPNNRPVFEDMLEGIEKGEAQGILCWEINRLSRNPVDSGKISWLLQQSIIKSIRTYTREYKPEDNVLLFNVESGMANQFIIDLKRNTKRGLEGKIQRGWLPCLAPTGYLNTPGEKPIIKDPERFLLVRKMWDLMLTGNYTPPQILEIANKKWGFRTKRGKKHGGKELSNSSIYRIFTNPFYCGILRYNGKDSIGSHESMITVDEYDKVQILLGREGKPRPKTHEFSFTGMIKCGECGCYVTAEEKVKVIKTTGDIAKYIYYRCSRKNKNHKCQQPVITLGDFEKQVGEEISKFTISPRFRDWAIKKIKEKHEEEVDCKNQEYEMQQKSYAQTQKQIDNLIRMRYSDMVTDEQFDKEKEKLENDLINLKQRLDQTHKRSLDWLELTQRAFYFAENAKKKFDNGDIQKKKEVLASLGLNFTLKDKKLYLNPIFWLERIIEKKEQLDNANVRLELAESGLDKGKEEAFASVLPIWGR